MIGHTLGVCRLPQSHCLPAQAPGCKGGLQVITYYNTHGKVCLTGSYFAELISDAVQSGVGVAGMANKGAGDEVLAIFYRDFPEKGVRVTEVDGGLDIELHIKVTYGLNIAEAVRSVTHRVKFVVEEATGLKVRKVRVSVDDMVG